MNESLDIIRRLQGKRQGGTLNPWRFLIDEKDGEVIRKLQGAASGDDERFDKDAWVTTTAVVEYHEEYGIVETRNTYYNVGPDCQNDLDIRDL